ncbi:cold-shock protein [Streptomyces tropicalis]|uniref:Cold shock domain-containing protein n=1 Tax=Streptomyces tropicalis TaxID=3034234 RepID=A0ABT6A8Y4_9ACTN|nr:cold shock domain-containing protein [Streptomyces tropicalis]MDF3300816.1 cold shock domain-containing protein [Streptomyces tropicalis]
MIEAMVREWDDDEGWGVLDSRETPGGCWTHFSVVEAPGFRSLAAGQKVALEWESGEQDGFQYRAIRVVILE